MSIAFEAGTGEGRLHLKLPGLAADAVAAALALAEHEPVIAALEDWLGEPLDPKPLTAGEDGATLTWLRCGELRLGLPWALLVRAQSAPALEIDWPALVFDIAVAEFDAPPLPPHARGGVLLLAEAAEAAWPVRLSAREWRDWPLHLQARWAGPGQALELDAAPVWGARAPAPWRVQLDQPLQRTLPELLGWTATKASPLPGPGAVLLAPAAAPRAGTLAPALGGTGLWLSD